MVEKTKTWQRQDLSAHELAQLENRLSIQTGNGTGTRKILRIVIHYEDYLDEVEFGSRPEDYPDFYIDETVGCGDYY